MDSASRSEPGPELYEGVARPFVELVLERRAGAVPTLNDAYVHFLEYLKRRKMEPVNRRKFKGLAP